MMESNQLLLRYVRESSEEAFRELVTRYIDMVYSTAVRRIGGDMHLAHDVTQIVFADLASKATSLGNDTMLGGWLHRHTCFVSATLVRSERRRRAREQHAVEMNTDSDHADALWIQLTPVLDDAINQLGRVDRSAIVLRFFERRELRLVGAALGISEDAARKRVARAIEKLRASLARRGVTLSAATLATVLASEAVTAAPLGWALSIAGSALAGASTATGITLTLIKVMAVSKIKLGLAGTLAVAAITTPIVLQRSLTKLQKDNTVLRQQVETHLRAENDELARHKTDAGELQQLRKEHRELLRLRGEVGLLRKESQELAQLRARQTGKAGGDKEQSGRGAFLSADSWANVGTESPEAALQTFFWAARQKESDLVGKLIRWRKDTSVPDVEGLDDIMQSLVPASSRFVSNLEGVRLVATKAEDADTSRMRVEFAPHGGKIEQREFQFVREDGQWMPLFHAWSPREGSIQAAFDVPLSSDMAPAN